jgi:antitoxin YefM
MNHMTTLTYSAAKAGLAKAINTVRRDRTPIAIHQKSGDVVMMCLEDYQAWAETIYLLRSPRNARRLISSIDSVQKGKAVSKSMEELLHAER